jgi:hypothetical protein
MAAPNRKPNLPHRRAYAVRDGQKEADYRNALEEASREAKYCILAWITAYTIFSLLTSVSPFPLLDPSPNSIAVHAFDVEIGLMQVLSRSDSAKHRREDGRKEGQGWAQREEQV